MKTLLFTLEYPPFKGGVANVYKNIVKYWPSTVETRRGASPALTRNTTKTRRGASLRGDIFVLHNNDGKLINNKLPFLKWLPSVWQLWKELRNESLDKAKNPPTPLSKGGNINTPLQKGGEGGYSHILVGHILPLGTAAYLVTKLTKTPYSIILHGMDLTFALKTARKRRIAKKILNNAQSIICMNSYVGELVEKFMGDDGVKKVVIVNPGVEARKQENKKTRKQDELRNKYNLENKIILLSVGRLVKRKGFDKVIESLPEVLRAAPNLAYVILGDGPEIENLKFKIENLALKENTIIITDADDDKKNLWYKISDIFIMPSRNIGGDFEGFGIVFLEANLAGKPVIAGDSGGIGDAVENGVNGLLVDPNDTNDITYAIIKLSKDEQLRKKLGEQGRVRAERDFNWKNQVERIYRIIKQKKSA